MGYSDFLAPFGWLSAQRRSASGFQFMAYHDGQPFNENHLRPCPMLENPEQLREMIAKTGAHSTDLQSPESAEHLCAKCDLYAMNWKPEADRLWAESHPNGAKKSE